MHLAFGAAALLLIAGPDSLPAVEPARGNDQPNIQYAVRFVDAGVHDVGGRGWRDLLHDDLRFLDQQGGATIWTCGPDALRKLLTQVRADPDGSIVQSPNVTATSGALAEVANETQRQYVADVERVADGPRDQASRVAYKPLPRSLREGVRLKIAGERSADGVKTRISIDDQRCLAMHNAMIRDQVHKPGEPKPYGIATTIQIPEVRSVKVGGDWLIPTNRVFVVSLGVMKETNPRGKSALRERLVIIEAR